MMLCNPKAGKFEKGEKIKEFLDKGSTMLVSFGSVVKTFTLPKAKLQLFLNVFEKLKPLQILLKWEDDSKNVLRKILILMSLVHLHFRFGGKIAIKCDDIQMVASTRCPGSR